MRGEGQASLDRSSICMDACMHACLPTMATCRNPSTSNCPAAYRQCTRRTRPIQPTCPARASSATCHGLPYTHAYVHAYTSARVVAMIRWSHSSRSPSASRTYRMHIHMVPIACCVRVVLRVVVCVVVRVVSHVVSHLYMDVCMCTCAHVHACACAHAPCEARLDVQPRCVCTCAYTCRTV